MTQTMIDDASNTVTRSLTIAAAPELVHAVLTDPQQVGQWFAQRAEFPDGVAPGAEGTFWWEEHGGFAVRIEANEPPHTFAFTWANTQDPIGPDNATTATFTLEPDGDGTSITVVETGFERLGAARRRAAMEENAQGWTGGLNGLGEHVAALSDGGTGLRPAADLDAGRITRTVLVRAPIGIAWECLTEPEAIEAWWGHPAVFPDGMAAGSAGTFEWVGHGLMPMLIECFDAPRRFDLRWGDLGDEKPGPDASLVEFTLTAAGEAATLVTVVETGFTGSAGAERRAAIEENVSGWTQVMNAYVAHTARAAGAAA